MTSPLSRQLWGAHLLALVLLAGCVLLGLWQLDAWQARRDAEARDLTQVDPVPLQRLMGPDDPFPGLDVGRPVTLEGTWVPGGTVLISGREHDGRNGYWVVTPMAVGDSASDPAIPVVRGWTASRTDVPAPPRGRAAVVGWLQPGEGSGDMDRNPRDDVLPQLRTADLLQRVDQDLYGAYAVETSDVPQGPWPSGDRAVNPGTRGLAAADLSQAPAASTFTALRNLLYAVQWWFFGGFVVMVWWRHVRETMAGPPPEEDLPDGEGGPDGSRDDGVDDREDGPSPQDAEEPEEPVLDAGAGRAGSTVDA